MMLHDWYTNRDTALARDYDVPTDEELRDEYYDMPDIFRMSAGFHNGPECKRCGRMACHHCHREIYAEECPG